MKKILGITAVIMFIGVISLSILAFTDDDPKKQKTEATATEQCEKHQEAADTKPCCKEATEKDKAGCPKTGECKHHSEETSTAK